MSSKLFDGVLFGAPGQAFDFITNLLESSTEYSIIATGHDGKILLWNEGARRVYGYEPEDMIGKETSDVLHTPEDRTAGLPGQIMRAALRDGKWEGTLQRVRKDGGRFVARVVKTPLRDSGGGSTGFLLISKDVSDEMHLTEELQASQYYTRSLIESNIDALMTTDPVGIITDVNQQMEALTGRTREELIGSPFKQYFTDPARAEDGVRLVLREGKVTNYELTAVDKAGKETVVSYNATTFRDAEGRLQGVFAAARDVTDQKQLEVRLRDSQAYNRGLIEASVDGLITVDPSGAISDVNEQMCRMSGYERDELIGSPFSDYFVDGDAATAGVRQTFERGMVTDYVLTLATRDGRHLRVSFNASVFKDPSGDIRGIFASARDITEQATLQSQLAEERAYNRGLIEASLDGLVTVDPMLVVTDVNEQMCRMTGYGRTELIGTRFPDHFTDPKRAAEGVRLTLDAGAATNYELTLRAKDGRERLVSFNAAVFKDPSGEVRGIFASARDITEQASLTVQFAEERAYTRGLIEASVDGLVTVDQDLRITDVNEQMCRMAGRSRGQLVGSLFPEHFSEPDVARQGVRLTFEQGAVTNYVLRLRSASGGELPVSFNAAVFRDTAGNVRGIFASARDITAQTGLESELQASQSYTRSLIESNIDALMTTDPVGIITDVNQQMEALTGRTREELIGSPFKQYFTDPARAEDGVRLVLREGKVTNYELTAVDKAGKETVVSYNAATFYDRDAKLQGVFAAARDVTEQKRLEAQLQRQNEELELQYQRVQEANRQKSEFLANMSHELRTPLNGAIGFTQLVFDGSAGPLTERQEKFLGNVLTSSKHLLQLINDILDLAKVEAGKVEFQPEPVDLAKLTSEVVSVVREMAANKQLRVAVEIDEATGTPLADPMRLKQVLYNFVSNAIKFTPDGGSVTVRIRPEDADSFRIEVQDSGIGIKPEDLARLFVEFQQLDSSTAKKYAGTGLGLALTKRIAEAQGGRVGVISVPGQGSTFFAVLPRRLPGAVEVPSPAAAEAPPSGAGPRILVVEDGPEERRFFLEALSGGGYRPESVGSAGEATLRLRAERYAAVVLDLLLPDALGLDVLERMRREGPNRDTPVIVATIAPDLAQMAAVPIQGVLAKPVSAEELRAALVEVGVTSGKGQRVLVVDDDPDALILAEVALRQAGYEPVCVGDGASGLAAIDAEAPAAVILDLLMPEMDGIEFLSRLRPTDRGKRLPVLVWTGKDLSGPEVERLRARTQALVRKGEPGMGAVLRALGEALADGDGAAAPARRRKGSARKVRPAGGGDA